jgi:tetratricopeptide (TPR) repeat protein
VHNDWPSVPQGDVSALPPEERVQRLADFAARLRHWAATTDGTIPGAGPIISIETSAFKGGWLMPAIESVIGQTSRAWVYTIRWDGGDELARQVLEIVERTAHPQLRVFFGENIGIAPSNRFLTANSIGDFIIQLDDDDMFAPNMVERFVATVIAKPWAGIVRGKRDFIDEHGVTVPADPWFPFEPRHYQRGMVTDIHNHCQPALVSRAAYDRTAGWDGFQDYLYAGADCDIFLKVEEVGPIVLIDDILYHYRLSGRRTSLRITDSAAYDMWRRLADRTIGRIGLPLERENEQPPFVYRRVPRPPLTREMIDFVVMPRRTGAVADDEDALRRTVESLQQLGVPGDTIGVCARREHQASACNELIRAGARPLVCLLRAGVEFTAREQIDTLLAVMDQRDADLAGPKVLTASGDIHCADAGFEHGLPVLRGHAAADHGQFDQIADALWLPSSALILRREVDRGTGGFDWPSPDGLLAAADFCLKARQRDFTCVFVGTVAVHDPGPSLDPGSEAERQRFRERWAEAPQLLQPIAPAGSPYDVLCRRGNQLIDAHNWGDALAAFGEAIPLAPERDQAYEGLGRAFRELKQWDNAAAAFDRAATIHPGEFWHHYQLGDVLRQGQRWDEAIAAYERALALSSDVGGAHAGLGHALFMQRRWIAAVDAFQKAIALDPESFWSFVQLGSAQVELGLRREAVAAFQRAATLDHPEVFWAWYNLGDVCASMQRWQDAVAAYQKAIELRYPVASTHVQLGGVFVRLERWTDAAVAYGRAVTLEPTHADAYLSLGDVLSTLNRWDEAIAAYRSSIELKPAAGAYAGLGKALFMARQFEAAADAYQHAVAINPTSSQWHHSLGDALLNLQRLDAAAAAFQRAMQLNPDWSQRPLSPRVADAQQWIAQLTAAATSSVDAGAPLLFVFDTDYGELTSAMYLLLGQPELAARATFLMPSRLFVTNRDILPGRARHYGSVDDVIAAVDAATPDIVFLCSAYVYSFHEIFTLADLDRLVRLLRERGCAIVTTDPFLGLLSDLGKTTTVAVDVPADASSELRQLKDVLDQRLNQHFAVSTAILDGLRHIYPAFPVPVEGAERAAARGISFFNPRLLHSADRPAPFTSGNDPFWLFVLASRDYEVQAMFHGKDQFIDTVARKIEQTLQAGRHPVLIGPYDCVQALIAHMAAAGRWSVLEGVTLLTFCSFPRFSALLLSAEYVFYWNALSHSMFLRLLNEQPVFLFDRGHLVRNVTPLYERIVAWYYQGWDPIYIDPGQDLRVAPLDAMADRYRQAARDVVSRLRRSPLPAEMIRKLAEGSGARVS